MPELAQFNTVEEAVAELRRHPEFPVVAHCDEFDVELRALPVRRDLRLGDALAALGPWEGESTEELLARLDEARREQAQLELDRLELDQLRGWRSAGSSDEPSLP